MVSHTMCSDLGFENRGGFSCSTACTGELHEDRDGFRFSSVSPTLLSTADADTYNVCSLVVSFSVL